MTAPEPTHTVPHLGQRIPVDIVGPSTLGGRPAIRVEAAAGEPFQRYTHGGWVSDSRADFPPELVRPICRDTEADIELRFGGLLQDPDASAETVNAAMREWREVMGYVEVE